MTQLHRGTPDHLGRLFAGLRQAKDHHPTGDSYGCEEQWKDIRRWNSNGDIRQQAFNAGIITADENELLKDCLRQWRYLLPRARRLANRIVNELFYIRKHVQFEFFDRRRPLRDQLLPPLRTHHASPVMTA